jgi:hypothetical protein
MELRTVPVYATAKIWSISTRMTVSLNNAIQASRNFNSLSGYNDLHKILVLYSTLRQSPSRAQLSYVLTLERRSADQSE